MGQSCSTNETWEKTTKELAVIRCYESFQFFDDALAPLLRWYLCFECSNKTENNGGGDDGNREILK